MTLRKKRTGFKTSASGLLSLSSDYRSVKSTVITTPPIFPPAGNIPAAVPAGRKGNRSVRTRCQPMANLPAGVEDVFKRGPIHNIEQQRASNVLIGRSPGPTVGLIVRPQLPLIASSVNKRLIA